MKMKLDRPVIAIDFDGTIVTEEYPEIGKPIKGSIKYIKRLYNEGCYIIIHTCRSTDLPVILAKKYLDRAGIPYHKFNENLEQLIEKYGGDCRKLSADLYVDDRNLEPLPNNWKKIYKKVKKHFKGEYNFDRHKLQETVT